MGQAWQRAGRGGGDSEVFVTDHGKEVYFADLYGTSFTLAGSGDAGESWHVNPRSCDVPFGNDGQWLWAQPGGRLWMDYNGGRARPGQRARPPHPQRRRRQDVALRVQAREDACARGNLAVDAEGRVSMAGCNAEGPGVAVVEPASFEYAWRTVAPRSGEPLGGFCFVCAVFVVVDPDTEGNACVAWADPSLDGEAHDVGLSTSTDEGATWSEPGKVNKGEGSAVLPRLAAGKPGHVAVASCQSSARGDPNGVEAE